MLHAPRFITGNFKPHHLFLEASASGRLVTSPYAIDGIDGRISGESYCDSAKLCEADVPSGYLT